MQPPRDSPLRARRVAVRQARWPRGPLVLLVVGLIVVAFTQTPPGRGFLRLAGLAQPSPAYTALYFINAQRLPMHLHSGHVEFPVSFAVQNSSSTAKIYQWKIELVDGKKVVRASGGKLWNPGGGHTSVVTKAVKGVCTSGGSLRIVVSLTAPAESIDTQAVCDA